MPASAERSIAGAQLRVWQLRMVLPRLAQPLRSRQRREERGQARTPVRTCRVLTAEPRDPLNPELAYLFLNRFKEVNWAGMYTVALHLWWSC